MLPSGVFFESFSAERAYARTPWQRLALVLAVVFGAAVPWLTSDYLLGVITVGCITLVAVLGLQITVGMAGQLNLGQSAFVGIGAFVAAGLAARGWGPWLTLPLAALVAGAVSIVFGVPAIRVKGFYLALTTIAAQIMFPIVMIRLPADWFGGLAGMAVEPPQIGGLRMDSPRALYWISALVAAIALVAAFNLQRSRTGRAFRAIRDNDIASSVLGIDLISTKIRAFFAGAAFAGISGALYAYYVRYVTTDQFTLWLSVWYLGMLFVGGLTTPLGAVFGVAAITFLQEGVHNLGSLALKSMPQVSGGVIFASSNVLLGAAIILMLRFEPLGLVHRWNTIKASYRIWPYPRG